MKHWGVRRSLSYCSLILIIFLCSCADVQKPADNRPTSPPATAPQKRILIAYHSRTGNTREIANQIQQLAGGDLIQIETAVPYPADYQATVQQVARENETGYLPPLKTKIERIEQYDVVFLGFPTWGMQLPPPLKSFLRENNLRGKTVVPFNSNAGYGEGSSFRTLRELCAGCTVLEGFVTRGGIERDGQLLVIKDARAEQVRAEVKAWLQKINMLQ